MKWIGVSGSWRQTTPALEWDVKQEVAAVLADGNGIVTGGALGVDYLATELVRELDPLLERLKVILPTDLGTYTAHFYKRAQENVITVRQAKKLVQQLESVQKTRHKALIEGPRSKTVNKKAYFARNRLIANAADELLAFQVNDSPGTQHTIESTRRLGKKVKVYRYHTQKT